MVQRMATVRFTSALQRFLAAPPAQVEASTVGEALAAVFEARPALRGYALDDQGALRRHVGFYGRGDAVRDRIKLGAPVFAPAPEGGGDDPHAWSLGQIWVLESGGVPGRLWAGTMPGGLFRSEDGGDSWSLNEALWHMPERQKWMGVAGGEQPGINSVLVDPRNPADIRIGVSTAGVWASIDDGASWRIINRGMYNEYMPPEQREEPIVQDVHRLARCAAHPDVMWCQHHNGVFRSEDAGANWREIIAIRPSKFGFAVVAHPRDPDTAWFVPAVKDERRIPVEGKVVVARTRDGG